MTDEINEYIPVLENKWKEIAYKLVQKSSRETSTGLSDFSIQILISGACLIESFCAFYLNSETLGIAAIILFITSCLTYFLNEKFLIPFYPSNKDYRYQYKVWTPIHYLSEFTLISQLIFVGAFFPILLASKLFSFLFN